MYIMHGWKVVNELSVDCQELNRDIQ